MAESPLEAHVRREMRKMLVQRAITCPRTGTVLDIDESVFINDSDGDPAFVMSQEGWRQVVAEGNDEMLRLTHGVTVDPTTVKGA